MAENSENSFPTTSQTLLTELLHPQAGVREPAWERFCELYYLPVYGFMRRQGMVMEDAWDQTQIFFTRFAHEDLLKSFDPGKGKFRSWLMTCAQNQTRSENKARNRQKRGGDVTFVPFDPEQAEREWQAEQTALLNPDLAFDLQLARNLWRGLTRSLLQSKGDAGGKAALTQGLLPLVLLEKWPKQPFPTQEEMAAAFGTTTNRLRAYFNHTLKKKARRIFEEEAVRYSPGISTEDVKYLWTLLSEFGESPH